jgi:plastocyanin
MKNVRSKLREFGRHCARQSSLYVFLASAATAISCSDFQTHIPENTAPIVTILESSFSPTEITAEAGETVFFSNLDGVDHQILSESDLGAFDDTGIIDTGILLPEFQAAVVIPEDAQTGDQFFFYCGIFTDAMLTPDGT